jgi:hypothetical protein
LRFGLAKLTTLGKAVTERCFSVETMVEADDRVYSTMFDLEECR